MRRIALGLLFSFCAFAALAALHFPALTGRVVDDAHILSPQTIQTLEQKLAEYEHGTANQIVVVTLSSLQGDAIEDYGYQLGRYWKIGQKGKDNGALLIIAPHERKVRIEAGYGDEPLLTDAASSQIIRNVIEPDFRVGRMDQGIVDGTQAMMDVLGGHSEAVAPQSVQQQATPVQTMLAILFMILFFGFAIRHPFLAFFLMSNSRFGGSSGNSWGGGGFSGGGGSFGGGGASGSW